MDAIIVIHMEEDPFNENGARINLPREKQTLKHISYTYDLLEEIFATKKLNLALKYGGSIGSKLLRHEAVRTLHRGWCILLHPHGEVFSLSKGWVEKPCNSKTVEEGYRILKEEIGVEPPAIVFGDWIISPEGLKAAERLGIEKDASYVPYRNQECFVMKPPFRINKLLEVPVTSDGLYPLNAIVSSRNLGLLSTILKKVGKEHGLLHLVFHSYDLFRFSAADFKIDGTKVSKLRKMLRMLDDKGVKLKSIEEVDVGYDLKVEAIKVSRWRKIGWTLMDKINKLSSSIKRY